MKGKTCPIAVVLAATLHGGVAASADFTRRDTGPNESQMLAGGDGGPDEARCQTRRLPSIATGHCLTVK